MRLWSLHPQYLDTKGLVALWREALLAKHIIEGKTESYKHHPQAKRFLNAEKPYDAIHQYLCEVYKEAVKRGYTFNKEKFCLATKTTIPVMQEQVDFEWKHLKRKLKTRDPKKYKELLKIKKPRIHPLFRISKKKVLLIK